MELKILAIGDIVSESGLVYLGRNLRRLRREEGLHFVVANGENAAGVGLEPDQVDEILDAGVDVITLGNHTWGKIRITNRLDNCHCLLRPANYSRRVPGRGWGVFDGPQGLRIGVVNLIGRVFMDPTPDSPFTAADRILRSMEADLVLVDFHAEATSEKLAMGWYLDGRAAAVWGTHTHVPTSDTQILPKGTGYVTDLGMTGPALSVLGVKPELSINKFLGGLPRRYMAAEGPCKLDGVIFTWDTATRRCTQVRRVALQEERG